MPQVTYHGTREDVRQLLRGVVSALAGRTPDANGFVRGLQLRIGNVLLSKVQQAFEVKSRGGRGDDGIEWQPLKRSTIAQRRTTGAERKAAGVGGKRTRGLLTSAQDQKWKRLFASKKAQLVAKFGVDEQEASARAAAFAWTVLKSDGAQTKLGLFGGRQVDILRDTGELFRSLTPGVESQPSGKPGQILTAIQGVVTIGTNKKAYHHRGTRKLPSRPFWPLDGQLPPAWWQAIHQGLSRGLVTALALVFSQGGRR